MLDLPAPSRRRRPSLTPMIDVVFLLLVFFMLAARFGVPQSLPLNLATGGDTAYDGPPRLVTVLPDALRLNGIATTDLAADLTPLMGSNDDVILLRARDGADVQRLVQVIDSLRAAGFTQMVVLE